jgi:GNAT superfamily N-acetyltransferase
MRPSSQLPSRFNPASDVVAEVSSKGISRKRASPELSGLAHKVHRNWQDYGWYITLDKILAYLVRSVYFRQVYRIYRINLADAKLPAYNAVHDFTFKILTPQDANVIAQIEAIAEWLRGRLKEAIAGGQPCLVAMDGDRVAGFNLVRLDHATLTLVNLTRGLRKDCAWSEHVAVKKGYRKAGLGSQLRLRIFQELKRRGFRRLYGGTLVSNKASLSLARSVGFKEIADVHYCKFLSLEKWRYKRVRG